MKPLTSLCSLLTLALGVVSLADAAERQLGAHQHGHGTVNMVIEGSTLWIELEAPGADIVGFEHAAESADDEAAVEAAKARLADPLALFAITAEAGCAVESAAVDLVGHESEEAHEEGEVHEEGEAHEGEEDGRDDDAAEEGGHSEFHAEYKLVCAQAEVIDEVGFPYFELFQGAEELDVTVITDAGQSQYEVERDGPALRLGND
jgi:hypothetical protein